MGIILYKYKIRKSKIMMNKTLYLLCFLISMVSASAGAP